MCLFCKIVEREIPSDLVLETDDVLASDEEDAHVELFGRLDCAGDDLARSAVAPHRVDRNRDAHTLLPLLGACSASHSTSIT